MLPTITVNNIDFINNYHGTKKTFGSGVRNAHVLGYQVSGKYEHTFPHKKVVFKKDTVFFINAKSPYTVVTKEIGNSISFYFTCLETIEIDCIALDCTKQSKLAVLFEKAYADWNRHDETHHCASYANLYNAILQFNLLSDKRYAAPETRSKLTVVLDFIDQNIGRKIKLEELAAIAAVSERRLRTIFLEHCHMPPYDYILSRRMQLACSYLKTDLYSTAEIAELTGFSDFYYFNKCFKKHLGLSPNEYKKNILIEEY